jgi:hypothetical protein
MKGQWLGRFQTVGPNGMGTGNLLIDIDEVDGAYHGYAVLQSDQANLPIVFARFFTNNTAPQQNLSLNLLCLDPRNWEPAQWNDVSNLYPGVTFTPTANATLHYQNNTLNVSRLPR